MVPLNRRQSAGLLTLLALVSISIVIYVFLTQNLSRPPAILGLIFPLVYAGIVVSYLKRYYHHPTAETLLWTVAVSSYLITAFFVIAALGTIWAQESSGGEMVGEVLYFAQNGLGGSMLGLVIGHILGQVIIARSELADRQRQLETQMEHLDEFANIVSHDLRNPLNVAKGRLELATEECESEHLDTVSRALVRMETLIDDMLSLARAGQDVGELEPVELSELITRSWSNVATESADLLSETNATVRADKSRLQQLLENLLRNAIEHGGPEVTIEVCDLPDGFYVEDDGPGIPEEERDDVLNAGYSSTEDGTGFGLSIVRDIAHAHDWEISVKESSEGGARFEFSGVETK